LEETKLIRTYDNKIKWCPICNQGWVEIVKEIETNILFCFCWECETEWDDPANIENDMCNYPEKYGQICTASVDEIRTCGYEKYIIK
jgi:hypothetical protein